MKSISDIFAASPLAKKLLREHADEVRHTRETLVEELEQSEREIGTVIAAHERPIDKLRAAADAARKKADDAADALRAAQGVAESERFAIAHRMDIIRRELRQLADDRIEQARSGMFRRYEDERRRANLAEGEVRGTQTTGRTLFTNEAALQHLLKAMQQASARFEALVFQKYANLDVEISRILEPVEAAWREVRTLEPRTAA